MNIKRQVEALSNDLDPDHNHVQILDLTNLQVQKDLIHIQDLTDGRDQLLLSVEDPADLLMVEMEALIEAADDITADHSPDQDLEVIREDVTVMAVHQCLNESGISEIG